VVFQEVSSARKQLGRILPQSTDRKTLRDRVSPLSLVQFRLGTTQYVRFKNRLQYHIDEDLQQFLAGKIKHVLMVMFEYAWLK